MPGAGEFETHPSLILAPMPSVGKSDMLCRLGATLGFRRADDVIDNGVAAAAPGLFLLPGGTYLPLVTFPLVSSVDGAFCSAAVTDKFYTRH